MCILPEALSTQDARAEHIHDALEQLFMLLRTVDKPSICGNIGSVTIRTFLIACGVEAEYEVRTGRAVSRFTSS